MKRIKVLGSGCAKCSKTIELIAALSEELNIPVSIEKETDAKTIMSFGVMSTPAVVVDEQLLHSGSIPHREDIQKWLEAE